MALVWAQGETIVLVKRSSRLSGQIQVFAAEWDHSNESFVLSSRIVLPVAADAELLTGGSVLDSETGLLRSYLVLGKVDSVYIYVLDFDQERPDLIAKLTLPSSSSSECCIEDCWLVDGPTVVALWKGQLLLVTSGASYSSAESSDESEDLHGEVVNTPWEAHILCLPKTSEQQAVSIHFCGDVKSSENQEVILSLTEATGKRLRTSWESPEGYLQSWSFYSLTLDAKGQIIPDQLSHGKGFTFTLSKQMPTELDPKLITCIQPVALEPSTTETDCDYILIGTSDRRLLRCRHAQIVEVLYLEAIPSQLHFGVVAGGQGVLLIVLHHSQQKVVAVCPESLEILQDWSKVWRVVVGDFTSSGHDQIILLEIASGSAPPTQLELNFTVVHGFSSVTCEGIQQGSQQHLAETKAKNDCKVSGMETICKALQERVEAGLQQLQIAKKERDAKKELVHISSCLMQNLITRLAFEQSTDASVVGDSGSSSGSRQDRLELVVCTKVWSRMCGMNWFFMVEIEMTAEARPEAALHNVSLLLTSLNCSIGGKSSILKSFSRADGRANLVVCIPYQEFSLRPGLPFDVSVRASAFQSDETVHHCESSVPSSRVGVDVYTQWLGGSEVVYPTLTPNLEPKEASSVLEQGEQVQFVIAAKSEEHLSDLSGYIQSTLRMQAIPSDEQEHKSSVRWFNLCSANGHGPYTAMLCYLGLHTVIKLRAVDADLLVILEQTIIELFNQHQFEIVSRIIPHEALEKLDDFVKTLSKQLTLQDSSMQNFHDKKSGGSRYVAQRLETAVEKTFSKIWASIL